MAGVSDTAPVLPPPATTTSTPSVRRRVLRAAIWLVVAVFAWVALDRLIGRIDWTAVGNALGRVEPWMALPLLAMLLVRQVLNAVPLVYYVPGLSWGRSVQNDLAANVVATFAPPPGDIVLRIAMFRSWGLDPVRGMTGVTLNSFKFYAVRFLVPGLGLLLLTGYELSQRQYVLALASLLVAAAILGMLVAILSSQSLARRAGYWAGRLLRTFRRSTDPDAIGDRAVELRHQAADSLRRGLAPSLVALVGMTLADATILLLALRSVGVGPDTLPVTEILGMVLLTYPLTTLPLFGFGVIEAILIAAWTLTAGVLVEPSLVAATIVWRIVTILGTLAIGAVVLVVWRVRARSGFGASVS
ncbi:hypothetical protein FH969_03985 [Miniimonas arenae]|uniref:Flippase-like domain-containing protein n=1 Tax=Miniimonas arenae TaxID=676201 RepID=A0A5C5BEZ2_9MICO|nr:hypothetical protein FH969_03985 [Miniimonas arenae]